ncbi:MAG: hypothetical protein ACOYMA_21485 [Bacteroidia bacterium]
MNYYNLFGYFLYLIITFYITVIVGKILYKNGIHFLVDSFNGNVDLAQVLNKFLLAGYYLLNLGYATVSINLFTEIFSVLQLIEEISKHIGFIVVGLSVFHYINLYTFSHFSKQIQKLYHNNH